MRASRPNTPIGDGSRSGRSLRHWAMMRSTSSSLAVAAWPAAWASPVLATPGDCTALADLGVHQTSQARGIRATRGGRPSTGVEQLDQAAEALVAVACGEALVHQVLHLPHAHGVDAELDRFVAG